MRKSAHGIGIVFIKLRCVFYFNARIGASVLHIDFLHDARKRWRCKNRDAIEKAAVQKKKHPCSQEGPRNIMEKYLYRIKWRESMPETCFYFSSAPSSEGLL